jgi:hypothetical protein
MERGLSLSAAAAAILLVVSTGATGTLDGPWGAAAPVLAVASVAAIVVSFIANRRAISGLLGKIRALLPAGAFPPEADPDQLVRRLDKYLGEAREERG